ncbi:hypothetical protein [Saccharopolyspora sp. NPDC002376]
MSRSAAVAPSALVGALGSEFLEAIADLRVRPGRGEPPVSQRQRGIGDDVRRHRVQLGSAEWTEFVEHGAPRYRIGQARPRTVLVEQRQQPSLGGPVDRRRHGRHAGDATCVDDLDGPGLAIGGLQDRDGRYDLACLRRQGFEPGADRACRRRGRREREVRRGPVGGRYFVQDLDDVADPAACVADQPFHLMRCKTTPRCSASAATSSAVSPSSRTTRRAAARTASWSRSEARNVMAAACSSSVP